MAFLSKSVSETADQIASGEIKSAELVGKAFSRIEEGDKAINSFITLTKERALKRASEIDVMSSEEKRGMALPGIPVAVKDNMSVRGVKTTCASEILGSFVPPYTATAVSHLEREGAVVVGKCNMDEFAMGSSSEKSAFGPVSNPVDNERVAGGSSGGSAASVGADFVPVSLGSDTGGSIRQPANFCGVCGLKPTYGRVSRYGLVAFGSSLDQIGPIARDVRDLGVVLSVISKECSKDSTYASKVFTQSGSDYKGDLSGLRIGMPEEYFRHEIDPEVASKVDEAVESLKSAGASVKSVSIPSLEYSIPAYYILCTAEASSNLERYDGVKYGYRAPSYTDLADMYKKTREEGFGREVKRRIMLGTYVLSSGYYDAYYLKAAKVRTLITKEFERVFSEYDALISPVTAGPAFKKGEKADPLQMYLSDIFTVSTNLAGIPGISIPYGETGAGLPVGVQLMAPKWQESTLLSAGFVLQQSIEK